MAVVILLAAMLSAQFPPQPQRLDDFDTLTPWQASASDGVGARIGLATGALRLDYDFGQVSGYAVARRTLPIEWPPHFLMTLRVRGTGGVNDLQLKFTDATGTNVWWVQKRNFRPSAAWQTMRRNPHIRRGLQRAGFAGGWLS